MKAKILIAIGLFVALVVGIGLLLATARLAKKGKGPKDVLKLAEEKGIELDEDKRKFIEEAIKKEEELEKQAKEHQRWAAEQRKSLKGKWKKVLEEQIGEADRIEIQTIPFADNNESKVVHVIGGNEKIRDFLVVLEIAERRSTGRCGCYGDALLVFWKGQKKLATLSYHHSRRLRWHDGPWPSDAAMSSKSQVGVPKWFASQGYTAFEDQRQRRVSEDERQNQESKQFVSYFPLGVQLIHFKTYAKNPIKRKLKELRKKYPGTSVHKLYSSMMALGSRNRGVSYVLLQWKEFAMEYPGNYSARDFANAFAELQGNRDGMYGAACLFFKDAMESYLPSKIESNMSEEERIWWCTGLGQVVLEDSGCSDKICLLNSVGRIDNPEIRAFLLDVARERIGREVDYAKQWSEEPGIRAAAYLSLALQSQEWLKEEIKQKIDKFEMKQDRAALEVALALLGEDGFLKGEHFELQSYLIGMAGLSAIEKNPSKEHMDILVNAGIKHPYGHVREEAKYLFQKITNVDWLRTKGDKEGKKMPYLERTERITNWWESNRDE